MRAKTLVLTTAMALVMVAGCIVNDQFTTITMQPDGSADWVKFQSNTHSTLSGEKGADELKRFVDEFDAHRDPDYMRITESGGEVLEARWVRREEPYANLLVARFPNWTTFQNFMTFKDEKGEVVAQPQFTHNGNKRRLSLVVPLSDDEQATEQPKLTIEELRREQANNVSETRLVVTGGRIIASQGFIVASDRRSALLDPVQLRDLVHSGKKELEVFLEWELSCD
jgi:hypothetical protein